MKLNNLKNKSSKTQCYVECQLQFHLWLFVSMEKAVMLLATSEAAFLTLQNVSFNLVLEFVKNGGVTRITNQALSVIKNFKT